MPRCFRNILSSSSIYSYSLSYIPIHSYCLNLDILELEILLLEFQHLQSGWIKLAKEQWCHLYNQLNSFILSEVDAGCADHRRNAYWTSFLGGCYRGLNSFLPCLGIAFSWKGLTMPRQYESREVWPPGLHLGHLWSTIQFQSSLWDWLRSLPQLPSAQSCFSSFHTGHVLPMQKRVNLAAQDCYPLKHLLITLALGWAGNLSFSRVYIIPRTDKSSLLCLNCCKNNVVYAKHLLSFWESGFWYVQGQGYLCDQCPIKNLGMNL